MTKRGGSFTAAELVGIFAHCKPPYVGLTSVNGASFTIPFDESFRSVLKKLKDAGHVRNFHKKRGHKVFQVEMAG